MAYPNIQYLQRHQIDTGKWDRCISHAANGLLYGYSFYLDYMADAWDALVLGDYEAVMPLTWRKKYGIKYLCQPFTTAHLGVFSGRPVDKQLMETFISSIPGIFKLIDIDLNEGNNVLDGPAITQRRNYVLPLKSPYSTLYENYNRHARRKLRKAAEAGLQPAEGIAIEKITELSYQMMAEKDHVPMQAYEKFISLFKNIKPHVEACNTMAAVDRAGNIIASDAYIVHKQRVYSLLAGNRPEAYECGGFYFVLDNLIKKYAGSGYLFDFEGSDVPGIAFVFECLGGQLNWYPHLAINKLPPVVRWLKRSPYERRSGTE
ncbi:hypothetical protein [Longitalea luteola]|uniref:hypothetical protein n=1 Tax=Longitalea luteola TaxID=2812563 RepID=UPI001A96E964|nr:hypothetical protein [Longitalea luteola]